MSDTIPPLEPWTTDAQGKGLLIKNAEGVQEVVTWKTGADGSPDHLEGVAAVGVSRPDAEVVSYFRMAEGNLEIYGPDSIRPTLIAIEPNLALLKFDTRWDFNDSSE